MRSLWHELSLTHPSLLNPDRFVKLLDDNSFKDSKWPCVSPHGSFFFSSCLLPPSPWQLWWPIRTHTLGWVFFAGVMCFVVWRYQSGGCRLLECLKEIKQCCRLPPARLIYTASDKALQHSVRTQHDDQPHSPDKLLRRKAIMSLHLATKVPPAATGDCLS